MSQTTALPYPQWWRDGAAKRKASLDGAVERLRAYCAADPSIVKALVFGSYANDSVGPYSDLDVMLVQESELGQIARTVALYVGIREAAGVSIDLVVYTPDEFELLSRTRNFVIQAVAQGRWIYARTSA